MIYLIAIKIVDVKAIHYNKINITNIQITMSEDSNTTVDNKNNDSSILTWNSGGNLSANANIKEFIKPGGIVSVNSEHSAQQIFPFDGELTSLVVKLASNSNNNPAPGDDNVRTFTVRINGEDSKLFVTISNNKLVKSKNVNVAFKKFDLISLAHVCDGTPSNAIGIASVSYVRN